MSIIIQEQKGIELFYSQPQKPYTHRCQDFTSPKEKGMLLIRVKSQWWPVAVSASSTEGCAMMANLVLVLPMQVISPFLNSLILSMKCSSLSQSLSFYNWEIQSARFFPPDSLSRPQLRYQLGSSYSFAVKGFSLKASSSTRLSSARCATEVILGTSAGSTLTVVEELPNKSRQVCRSALRGETITYSALCFSTQFLSLWLLLLDCSVRLVSRYFLFTRTLDWYSLDVSTYETCFLCSSLMMRSTCSSRCVLSLLTSRHSRYIYKYY